MSFKDWYYAIKPWRLPVVVVPVLLGTMMAFADGAGRWVPSSIAMCVVLLFQVGRSFLFDALEFKKGRDIPSLTGAVGDGDSQNDQLSQKKLIAAAAVSFFVATLTGIWIIVKQEAWGLIPIGVICILVGVFDQRVAKSTAYIGADDCMYILLWNSAAVIGTYYIQALSVTFSIVVAGLGYAVICCCLLGITNYFKFRKILK